MKEDRKKELIEHLRDGLTISHACSKVGVTRNTFYRWKVDDKDFLIESKKSMRLGVGAVNDLAESKLIQKIHQGSLPAIRYRLTNRHPDYHPRKKPSNDPIDKVIVEFRDMSGGKGDFGD